MTPLLTVLGSRIRELRIEAGLTQEQLAEAANLSLKHLGEIERGRGNPTFSSLERISGVLGITLHKLFDFEPERLSDAEIKKELQDMLAKADPSKARLAYRIFKAILKP